MNTASPLLKWSTSKETTVAKKKKKNGKQLKAARDRELQKLSKMTTPERKAYRAKKKAQKEGKPVKPNYILRAKNAFKEMDEKSRASFLEWANEQTAEPVTK